ncbi:MAG: type IIA DNA topoisomerase subunit B [Bacteroidales bacterium]|nr:type IIA DNA topoisomerase subunit B [Bacteroidales bacterium]
MEDIAKNTINYSEEDIKTLVWNEHIRKRPGMYIGKLGNGASADDGIYVLIKEIMDNSIDEFAMGQGKVIELDIEFDTGKVRVRDYGRGIPLGRLIDCVAKMNTGGKIDSQAFKKSVGMNGVGSKAVNAMSSYFFVQSFRDNQTKKAEFSKGEIIKEFPIENTQEPNGTLIEFVPDKELFENYSFINEYIVKMVKNYTYLNKGLTIVYNKQKFRSSNGLLDLLNDNMSSQEEALYPVIHLKQDDFEFAFTHSDKVLTEEHYAFVNGQHTTQGGTHLAAFREAIVRVMKDYFKKDYEPSDIRSGLIAAISLKIIDPVFESQTKTKLGSVDYDKSRGITVRNYINDIVKKTLDPFLYMHQEIADSILEKIVRNEKDRKGMQNYKKLAKESAKKTSLVNRKLCDCRVHYNSKDERRLETTLFITEGDSASGSITKSRDPNVQAVFSLRGKPYNSYGETKEIVYKNEEFNLLHAALNIDEDMDNLRYNNIVIATDADVDGMHIRMLLMTFFLQYFPELVKQGHIYILQTPLFRVRNKKQTFYCYSEEEKQQAVKKLKTGVEITRFKGLGEISPDEFSHFIGKDIRLDPVLLNHDSQTPEVLRFFMGKNTPERQNYIIDNLRYEAIEE